MVYVLVATHTPVGFDVDEKHGTYAKSKADGLCIPRSQGYRRKITGKEVVYSITYIITYSITYNITYIITYSITYSIAYTALLPTALPTEVSTILYLQ